MVGKTSRKKAIKLSRANPCIAMDPAGTPLKRKATTDAADSDLVEFTPLGSGREVGRSCHILRIRDKTIMLDCGVHPAYTGLDSLPFLDEVNVEEIDLILISHFHLDHVAGLPYLLKNPKFKGRVFMTHPTKSIYKLLLQDFVKVTNLSVDDQLYTEQDLLSSMDRIEVLNFHQVITHKGIRFWTYHAGHVLGAVMYMIEVGGVRVLYTGDYSRSEDRHLMAAEIPEVRPDVLVVEATHGTQQHVPAFVRERMFTEFIHNVVRRGGKCLLPQFALGRAQELLLILDEYWAAHPSLHDVPIYYASSLAKRCLSVYQSYLSAMNRRIQARAHAGNPFVFQHVIALKSMAHFDHSQPAVVMASPGMLQNGLSRELLEEWCTDPRNGVMIAGYCVENTLAYALQSAAPTHITTMQGLRLPLLLSVGSVPFTAHADCKETSDFVRTLQPPHVILVHGNSKEMGSLEKRLLQLNKDRNMQVASPHNCQTIEIRFAAQKIVKTAGAVLDDSAEEQVRLPSTPEVPAAAVAGADAGAGAGAGAGQPRPGASVSGLLVRRDFGIQLMRPRDLSRYTALQATLISQRVTVPFSQSFDTARLLLSQMFDLCDEKEVVAVGADTHVFPSVVVMGCVTVTQMDPALLPQLATATVTRIAEHIPGTGRCGSLRLTWSSGPVADMVSDAIVTLLTSAESNPGAARMMSEGSRGCCHGHDDGHVHAHGDQHVEEASECSTGCADHTHTHAHADIEASSAAADAEVGAADVFGDNTEALFGEASGKTQFPGYSDVSEAHECTGWSRAQVEGLVWLLSSTLSNASIGKTRSGKNVPGYEACLLDAAQTDAAAAAEGASVDAADGDAADGSGSSGAHGETGVAEEEGEGEGEGEGGFASMVGEWRGEDESSWAEHPQTHTLPPLPSAADVLACLQDEMGVDLSDEALGIEPLHNSFRVVQAADHDLCRIAFSVDGVRGLIFLSDLYVHVDVAHSVPSGSTFMTHSELRARLHKLCVGYYLSMVRIASLRSFAFETPSAKTAAFLASLGQTTTAVEVPVEAAGAKVLGAETVLGEGEEEEEEDEDEGEEEEGETTTNGPSPSRVEMGGFEGDALLDSGMLVDSDALLMGDGGKGGAELGELAELDSVRTQLFFDH